MLTHQIHLAGSVDSSKENQQRMALIMGFFRVYSTILDPEEVNGFESWLCKQFNVDVPPDWVGHSVPDHFWDVYFRPSLSSLWMYKGKYVPLDFALLEEQPLVALRCDGQLLIFIEDVCVMTANLLVPIRIAQHYIAVNQNFIVFGPPDSGKTTFLKFLLKDSEATPVYIGSCIN